MKALPLFPYCLDKHLAIPTSPLIHLLVKGFLVIVIIIIKTLFSLSSSTSSDGFSPSVLKHSLHHLYH